MTEAVPDRTTRWLKRICLLVAGIALAMFAVRRLGVHLWLDELLTMALLQADSLPKLWAGIASGIDGNPPLFLTLGWLLTHAMPALAPVTVLKLLNVAMTVAAVIVLYRVSLRVVSAAAAWSGAFLFLALNTNIINVALELRTYALYLLTASLAVLLQQRLIERRRSIDAVLLALACAALTLSHTIGIVYVGCIIAAGWLSQSGRRPTATAILTAAPALLVFACWLPFFLQQSAVGRPYIWIGPPTVAELLLIVFDSPLAMLVAIAELCSLGAAAALFVRRHGTAGVGPMLRQPAWQPGRYVVLLLLGVTALTLTAWVASVLLVPLFVARYFTPQLIVNLALHMAVCELVVRMGQRIPDLRTPVLAAGALAIPPAMAVMLLASGPAVRQVPCADASGAFFEAPFVHGDLPVVAESPHVFLPRASYADHAESYRFALDWDVVLNYPDRARGNATDFHIMENLKAWSTDPALQASIVTTDQILGAASPFLAIEQSGRAWFHHLRSTRNVAAEKLTEVTGRGGDTCTLWKVTGVKARN